MGAIGDISNRLSIVEQALKGLQLDFYIFAAPGYKATFTTDSYNLFSISYKTHRIKNVRNVKVFNPTGKEVSAVTNVLSDNSILIESNTPMVNFIILIK